MKTLMIVPDYNNNVYMSGRNLPKTKVVAAKDVNTYEILNANKVIIVEDSVKAFENLFNQA
jgi:large subunit ribosomal protein L4